MPSNIAAAAPTTVLPQTLCLSFSEGRTYANLENGYHDNTRQIGMLVSSSRRMFKLAKRLTSTQLSTLKTFWDSVDAGLKPFYFYNPYEGTPVGSNYDATGVATTGRHTVVFRGNWAQETTMQRTTVPDLALEEVA